MFLNFGKNLLKNSRRVQKFGQCPSIIHFQQQLQLHQPFRPHIPMRTFASERDSGGPKWIQAMLHKILLRLKPLLPILPRSLKLSYFGALDAEYARHESARNSLQCFICAKKIMGNNWHQHIKSCKVRNSFYKGEGELCPELFEAIQNEHGKPFDELEVRMIEHELKDALMSHKHGLFPHPNTNLCDSTVYLILDQDEERGPNKWNYVGTSVKLDDRIYHHRLKKQRDGSKFVIFMEGLSSDAAAFLENILIQMRDGLENERFERAKPVKTYSDKDWREKLAQLLLYRIHHGEAVPYKYNLGNGRKKIDLNSVQNEVSNEADAFNMSEEVVECEVEEQQNVEAEESETQCQSLSENPTLDCNESALMRENQEKLELADGSMGQDEKCDEILDNTADSEYKLTYKFVICKFCNTTSYLQNMKTHLKRWI